MEYESESSLSPETPTPPVYSKKTKEMLATTNAATTASMKFPEPRIGGISPMSQIMTPQLTGGAGQATTMFGLKPFAPQQATASSPAFGVTSN